MLTLRSCRLLGAAAPVDVVLDRGLVEAIGPVGSGRGELVDADGRWLLPGFVDEHVHFRLWAEVSRRLDVSAATSAADVARIVGGALATSPGPVAGALAASAGPVGGAPSTSAGPIIAAGFRDGLWPDSPHKAVLDAVTRDTPVYVVSGDLHACWLNSAALAAVGRADHPTGLLKEQDCFDVLGAVARVPDSVADTWVAEAARQAAARGTTGIVDFDLEGALADWARREAAGGCCLRVECGVYHDALDTAVAQGLATGQAPGAGQVTVGPLKIISDGSLNTRTAWCFDPYPGLTGPTAWGVDSVPPAELEDLVRRGWAAGLVPAVHAIGDRANAQALDAFAAVGRGGRIEHAQLLRREDVPRFAELQVTASVQPEHALDDRDVADRHWAGRTDRAFPFRDLLDAGATLALGSDAPVAVLDPWVA
ncbi:MAG: amidohydrolase family protein, partial [Propionibacteriaceae bacterium]|nr:amidohydrolase family protein [Propionibacteriaceae bacterium]